MATTARELFTTWGFDINDKPLQDLNKHVNSVKNTLKALSIAAAASAGALFGIAKSVADAGDKAAKLSRALGLTAQGYQALGFAAGIGGLKQQEFNVGIQRFSRSLTEAKRGMETYVRPFTALGISAKKLADQNLSAEETFLKVADALGKMPDGFEKTATAQELFGRSGAKLIPLFSSGAAGIRELMAEAHALGIVMDEELLADSEEFQDAMLRAKSVIIGIRNTIGAKLIPMINKLLTYFKKIGLANKALVESKLTAFIEGLISFIKYVIILFRGLWIVVNRIVSIFGGWERALKTLMTALGIFLALKLTHALGGIVIALGQVVLGFRTMGTAALIAQAKALAIPLLIGAGLIALGLIIEDLIGYFQGKDSITGRLLASFQETFPKLHKYLADFFGAYIQGAKLLISGFKTVFGWIIAIGKAVGKAITPALGVMGGFLKGGALGGITAATGGMSPATSPVSNTTNNKNVTGNVSIKPKIDISVNGAGNPKEVGLAVATEVKNVFSGIVRETGRDFPRTIEE